MDATDLTQFIPGLRRIPRPAPLQPEQDSPVPEPPLRYAEDTYSPTVLDRLARVFAMIPSAHDVGPTSNTDIGTAAILPFLAGFGRGRLRSLSNTPGTPEANAVLSQVNRQNQTQDQKLDINAVKLAAKAMREHQQSLKAQQKEAEQTPGTPEYQARVDRESQYQTDLGTATTQKFMAAGLPVPARYRAPAPPKPKAQPKAPKTPQEIASRAADVKAARDSTFNARGLAKPPHVYVRDKIAQAMAAGIDASQFEADVRKNADKLRANGLNPDSLVDRGWRSLKRPGK